jgi:hypothetical protein
VSASDKSNLVQILGENVVGPGGLLAKIRLKRCLLLCAVCVLWLLSIVR